MIRFLFATAFISIILDSFSQRKEINTDNITIARDSWGVAHIIAKTDAEAAYGLAWANAEDNFSTMQQLYMIGKGMYARYAGMDGAMYDYAMNAFRVKELVEEKYDTELSAEFRNYIEGYVSGVNTYAASHPEKVLLKGLFPITSKDIIQTYTVALLQEQHVASHVLKIINNQSGVVDFHSTPAQGSNGFAVRHEKTLEGKTFLLINPHQPLSGIGSNYEAHVYSEEGLNIHGGVWHGAMNPATFVNKHLAVMTTTNQLDFADVFQLEMNPNGTLEYKFDNEWLKLEKNEVKFKVKLNSFITLPVKRTVYWSKYGATFKNKSGYFSVRVGGNMRISAAEQIYRMNKATSFSEFKRWANYFPMENFIYADRTDTIFLVNNGLVPKRDTSYNWMRTVPGNSSKTLWNKFHSIDELPHYINPKAGYLYNVNNSAFEATDSAENLNPNHYPKYLNDRQTQNNRSERIKKIMKTHAGKISYTDFRNIKYDTEMPYHFSGTAFLDDIQKLDTAKNRDVAKFILLLKNWDRRNAIDSQGAAAFLVLTWYFYSHDLITHFYKENRLPNDEYVKALRFVKDYYRKHYHDKEVTLGEIQRFQRGSVDLPLATYPDVMAAMFLYPDKHGIFNQPVRGDGFVMFVQFSGDKVEIETSQGFGNSSDPASMHYNDQMQLYVNRQSKHMTLDIDEVLTTAVIKYHPR